ncbi:hypothetical protein [Lentzea sp. NEAU-D7]|uniref:hypothetical protein n=1 Tax=Lentzea sp. NEAU-D7 TaxID=2994667 RepID=UPI00224AE5F7|nr:hypothetical protein [Lentzea sp. NEAU-D7]MCX2951657.1 hypothetical protein [Lentzea sp. NEAU-D7]
MALAALVAGCAGEPAATPPPTTTTTTTTAPPTPAELNERAKAAIAAPDTFAAAGGQVKTNVPATDAEVGADGQAVAMICGGREIHADGSSVMRSRLWTGRTTVFQQVHAMADRPAAVLVKSVETGLAACTSTRGVEQLATLAKPAGVDDFYAYCEATLDPSVSPFVCHAFMGRGTLISEVVMFGQTKEAAGTELASVLPAFVPAFVKA